MPPAGVIAACAARRRLRLLGTDAGLLTTLARLEMTRETQATQVPHVPPHGCAACGDVQT